MYETRLKVTPNPDFTTKHITQQKDLELRLILEPSEFDRYFYAISVYQQNPGLNFEKL